MANPFEPAFVIEQLINRFGAHPLLFHQVEEDARIEITGARSHHQPLQRRKAHRRINTFSCPDRGRTGTVAEVQRNQIALLRRFSK